MNIKRFIWASLAVFAAFEIIDTIVHGIILSKTYAALADLWRPDMMSKMWLMHLGSFIIAFLFTYIFIRGYENKGLAEGVRYGLIIGLFMNIPYAFYEYAMYPLPLSLCLQWFVYGMIEIIICGIIVAAIYKK
jgi:CBS domain containing-hemolysin-like protein